MTRANQCLRGMRDLTPETSQRMHHIEQTMRQVAQEYGYQEIRFPILEEESLFQKSIGIETDIIGKEMYTFLDKNDTKVALRPEGTAGCLRSSIASNLIQRNNQKLFYIGPMFRRERPQRGRFRQFQHFGVEIFGYPSGYIDVELIAMTHRMWGELELPNISLVVNYIGSPKTRLEYRQQLQTYWNNHQEKLTPEEQTRAEQNPLRLLDSKNPELTELIAHAPSIHDCLNEEESSTFQRILQQLDNLNIPYTLSSKLVRGLDYYSDFVFEWISDDLGAQGTICGGGRYDPLVNTMGQTSPATGFAAGIDRIETLLGTIPSPETKIYVLGDSQEAIHAAQNMVESSRNLGLVINLDPNVGKIKNKINQAAQSGYRYILIFSDSLLSEDTCKIIDTLEDGTPLLIKTDALYQWLEEHVTPNQQPGKYDAQ